MSSTSHRKPAKLLVRTFAAFLLIATLAIPAFAATLTVNSTGDDTTASDGLVTLREAIIAALADSTTDLGETGSGDDTIVFAASLDGATITLGAMLPAITDNDPDSLTIDGTTRNITIDAASITSSFNRRIFFVNDSDINFTLTNLTLANGLAQGGNGGSGGGGGGGAGGLGGSFFLNNGNVVIRDVTFSGSSARGGQGRGGGSGSGGGGGGGVNGHGQSTTNAIQGSGGNGSPFGGGGGRGGNNNNGSHATGGGFGGGGGGGSQSGNPTSTQNGGPGGYGGGGGGGGNEGSGGLGGGTFGDGTGGNLGGRGRRGGGGRGAGLGGSIFARNGSLDLQNVAFINSMAESGDSQSNTSNRAKSKGGAIFVHPDATVQGTGLTFTNSTARDGVGTSYTPGVLSDTVDVYGVIEVAAPDVQITVVGPNPANTESVQYSIVFSEDVTGVDLSDFAIEVVTGSITAVMSAPTGSGDTYMMTVATAGPTNEGEFRLNISDDDSIVGTTSGRPLLGTGTGTVQGELAGVWKSMPQVTAITGVGASPAFEQEIAFDVSFERAVSGVTTAAFDLSPTLPGAAVDRIEDNGATQRVYVTGYETTGTGPIGLRLVSSSGIADLAGNVLDSSNLPFSDETISVQPGSLSGFVYNDFNLNRVYDPGVDNFFGDNYNIRLTGTDDQGAVDITVFSNDSTGQYIFSFLRPGTYTITQLENPSNTLEWDDSVGTLGGDNSVNDVISGIVMPAGGQGTGYDFGAVRTSGRISGYVYDDINNNGVRESFLGENGIGSVSLMLTGQDFQGNTITQSRTSIPFDPDDASSTGFYNFFNLPPGTYTITESQPTGYGDGMESIGAAGGTNANNDEIAGIQLGAGQSASGYDFGEQGASIGGRAWFDYDEDGQQDSDEPPLAVNVWLYDSSNTRLWTQRTNTSRDGVFDFGALRGGSYTVEFRSLATGFSFSPQDQGDDATDSDVDTSTATGDPIVGRTPTITISDQTRTMNIGGGFTSPCPPTDVLYVNASATGANNGKTWTHAFTSLQGALDLIATGSCNSIDEIWVAQGTYLPSSPSGRSATFELPDVEIYGGFNGTETEREQRNWATYPTILNGDLGADDDFSNNAYHVVSVTAGSPVLDGFVIEEGAANSGTERSGSGALISAGAATFRNVIVRNNEGSEGAVAIEGSGGLTFAGGAIVGNRATVNGAGVWATDSSISELINVTITGNTALGEGGGLATNGSAAVDLASVIVWGNVSNGSTPAIDDNSGATTASYSLIEGGFTGTGNISSDPLFVDADGADNTFGTADDDLRLSMSSPAIDAGDSTRVPEELRLDLGAFDRITDILEVTDTGIGSSPVVDMGGHERQRGSSTILYVDPDATGNGSGLSWANAFASLRDALLAAISGDEIWVANGTYHPSATNDVTESFTMLSGVAVYGGFEGLSGAQETSRGQRNPDPQTNGTILSGDIGVANDESDNSYHVIDASGVSGSILDGFTVRDGNAWTSTVPHRYGGGLIAVEGTPSFANIIFESNQAFSHGGAAYLVDTAASFTNCVFRSNYAGTSSGSGGAIWRSVDNSTFTDCSFVGNEANGNGGAIYATNAFRNGGFVNPDGSFVNTVISGNRALTSSGGGYYTNGSTDSFVNLLVTGNQAGDGSNLDTGGGFFIAGGTSDVEITHCVFSENAATSTGQAVYVNSGQGTLRNCIVENHPDGAAIELRTASETITLSQTLFNGNASNIAGSGTVNETGTVNGDPSPAFVTAPSGQWTTVGVSGDTATLVDSGATFPTDGSLLGELVLADTLQGRHFQIVSNTSTALTITGRTDRLAEIGNTASYEIKNYRLDAASPAIDAGLDFTSLAPASATDFDGTPRPLGSGFDIGAFEGSGALRVTGVTRSVPTTEITNATTVTYAIEFNSPISGLSGANLSSRTSGLTGAIGVTSVSAVGSAPTTSWTANVTGYAGTGTLDLDVVSSTGILDESGTAAELDGLPFNTGEQYTIDTLPPSISAPTDTGTYSTTTTVGFSWAAATDVGTGVASLTLRVGTTPGAMDVANLVVTGMTSANVTGANGQTLYASLVAVDGASNMTVSGNSDGITIDTTPPSVSTPTDAGAYSTSPATFNWAAASDSGSGIASLVLNVGTTPGASDVSSTDVTGQTTADVAGANGQTLYASLVATDNAGNVATSGNSDGVTIDDDAPTVSTPTDTGLFTMSPATFNWTAPTDSGSDIASLELRVGTTPGGTDVGTFDVTGQTTADVAGTNEQTLYAFLVATDNAGNVATSGNSDGITIDTLAPTISAPTDTGTFTTSPATFSWTAPVDSGSGVASLELRVGTTPGATDVTTVDVTGTTTADVVGTDGQTLYAFLVATDNAGNVATSGNSDGITIDVSDPSDPVLSSPTHTVSTWSNDRFIEIEWSGASDGGSLAGYSYLFDTSPTTVPDTTVDLPHSVDPHSVTSSELADGDSYWFHLSTCDLVGNCTSTVHLGPFWIDATEPSAPTDLMSTSHEIDVVNPDQTIDITWLAAADDLSGVVGYAAIFDQQDVGVCDEISDTSGTSFTSASLGDGMWYAHVCAVDAAGNWGPVLSAGPYITDLSPPQVTLLDSVTDGCRVPGSAICNLAVSQLTLSFSEPMFDPAGDSTTGDLSDPLSYLLVAAGGDSAFSTTSCATGVDVTDVAIGIDAAVANDAGTQVWLDLTGDDALARDRYRLIACGDDGLRDIAGNLLDGNGDESPGDDAVLDFEIAADILSLNPNFDQDANGFLLTPPSLSIVHTSADEADAPTSGSVSITGSSPAGVVMLTTCVPALEGVVQGLGQVQVVGGTTTTVAAVIETFSSSDCTGFRGATALGNVETGVAGVWTELVTDPVIINSSGGSISVGVAITGDSIDVNVDSVYLRTVTQPIFEDGFESGNTTLWSVTFE